MAIYALGEQVPTIHPTAFVHPEAVVIGSVSIGAESTIWACCVLRGDDGEIHIGDRTSVQDGVVVHTTAELPTTIGDDCVIGHLAHLEGCVIKDGSLVGSNATVLHAAVIESGALVGANALVPGAMTVPSRAMALGVPAKIRPDAVDVEEMIRSGAESYRARGHRYREELRRIG